MFLVGTVGGYVILVLYMLCGCCMFCGGFWWRAGLRGGFPSVRVCGCGYGPLVGVLSGTFSRTGLWWVDRVVGCSVKFPDTLQRVVVGNVYCLGDIITRIPPKSFVYSVRSRRSI